MTAVRTLSRLETAGLLAAGLLVAACSGSGATPPASPAASVMPLPIEAPSAIDYAEAMRLFEYDRARPFDIVEKTVTEKSGATIHDISYLESSGARTQAYLVLPPGPGPFGAVMYLHGGFGSSGDFMDEAVEIAGHGLASLLVTGPEWKSNPVGDAEAVTEIVFEMRELRRSLDLLVSRPEIDPARLGFVGVSFGAIRGGTFAGIEGPRLKIAVLWATPPSYKLKYMAPFDPIVWAPHVAPAALYLQEGTQDTWFSHDEAESLIAAAHEPKRLVWYDAGHGLNQTAHDDRIGWLVQALGGK
jgi:dienelactone hydrolase